jgi:hypothetical protein
MSRFSRKMNITYKLAVLTQEDMTIAFRVACVDNVPCRPENGRPLGYEIGERVDYGLGTFVSVNLPGGRIICAVLLAASHGDLLSREILSPLGEIHAKAS